MKNQHVIICGNRIKHIMLVVMVVIVLVVCDNDEEYIDPVIDMLLNGGSAEITEVTHVEESMITGGIWKCGNCTDLGDAKLVHSETNLIDADIDEQESEVEISLVITGMRCVTVAADHPGAVRKLLSTCDGSSVTLRVSPSHNFTVLVFA